MNGHNDGGPAFPVPIAGCTDGSVYNTLEQSAGELGGMTLRDYLAAKAMQALLHPQHFVALSELSQGESHVARIAKEAYWTADAMLAARGAA